MSSIKSKFYLQIFASIIILCSIAELILSFFISPTIKKMHRQSYDYANSSYQIKDFIDRQGQIKKTERQINQIQSEKILDKTSIKSEVALINFVKTIENLTSQLQLQESLHWLGESKIEKKYSILRFQIELKGKLENILKFTQEIENLSTPVEIQGASIIKNNKTKSGDKNQINANITFTVPGKIFGKI